MGGRTGWDSNPRYRCRYTGFRDRLLQPLGHLSCTRFRAGSLLGSMAPVEGLERADDDAQADARYGLADPGTFTAVANDRLAALLTGRISTGILSRLSTA
jgi:hypothetical protein